MLPSWSLGQQPAPRWIAQSPLPSGKSGRKTVGTSRTMGWHVRHQQGGDRQGIAPAGNSWKSPCQRRCVILYQLWRHRMRDESALGTCMAYIDAGSRFLEVLSTVPKFCHWAQQPCFSAQHIAVAVS